MENERVDEITPMGVRFRSEMFLRTRLAATLSGASASGAHEPPG